MAPISMIEGDFELDENEIGERLKAMMTQEASHDVVPDYLAPGWQQRLREATEPAIVVDEASPQINEVWREKICEWCYTLVDHFDFKREVVSVAMTYLDRYLATHAVNKRIFQLASMTALYLAMESDEPGKFDIASLITYSRGYFVAQDILTMRDAMFQSLNGHLDPPTSLAFVRDFMCLVSSDVRPHDRHNVNELASFMTELSACDYRFVTKKPSAIALASLINAIELQGPQRVDPRYKVNFLNRIAELGINIASDEVIECYEHLRAMYNAGGYTPTLDDASRVDTIPMEVA